MAAPLYHPDASLLLSHFIRPQYLVDLLRNQAFCLTRQDAQSDKNDGVLPAATFTDPYRGPLENSLRLPKSFLQNQAHAVASLRERTFIMCWTCDPAGHMRDTYGEHGQRCELHASQHQLEAMLGYEWNFPPRRRPLPEIPGGVATAELKEAFYTDGTKAVPVVPSAFATAHKDTQFASEAEFRVEAIVSDGVAIPPAQTKILWKVATFSGFAITIGSKVAGAEAQEIAREAKALGIPVAGA